MTLYAILFRKGYFTGVFENGGSHASPYKHFRCHTQASQPDGLRHTRVFPQKGFVYLNTPLITASDCEGAGQMFQVTTLDLNNVPKNKKGTPDYGKDFFGKQASLTVSGQLEGELGATALGDIYTFGPTFRAENSNTPRHLAEF